MRKEEREKIIRYVVALIVGIVLAWIFFRCPKV